MIRSIIWALLACSAACGAGFEAASVKPSKSVMGHDGTVTMDPVRFRAANATLKSLIFEAYQIPYSQISGGPRWINSDEFDIEAKAADPSSPTSLRLMLRLLLAERFKLVTHRETPERRVYALVAAKGGAQLRSEPRAGTMPFRGTVAQFADRLSIALAIPILEDPAVPSHPSGPPVPVVDQTGIQGVFDFTVDFKPEPGIDLFNYWQHVLQDQFGLRLESSRSPVEILVIDHAEKPANDGG